MLLAVFRFSQLEKFDSLSSKSNRGLKFNWFSSTSSCVYLQFSVQGFIYFNVLTYII